VLSKRFRTLLFQLMMFPQINVNSHTGSSTALKATWQADIQKRGTAHGKNAALNTLSRKHGATA